MGEEKIFIFPELNGIKLTREDIEKILDTTKDFVKHFDLIEAD